MILTTTEVGRHFLDHARDSSPSSAVNSTALLAQSQRSSHSCRPVRGYCELPSLDEQFSSTPTMSNVMNISVHTDT